MKCWCKYEYDMACVKVRKLPKNWRILRALPTQGAMEMELD